MTMTMTSVSRIGSEDLRTPPMPPEKNCEVCGVPIKFVVREQVPKIFESIPMAYYRESIDGHEKCHKEKDRRQIEVENQRQAEEANRLYRDRIARSGLSTSQSEKTFNRFSVTNQTKEAFDLLGNWKTQNAGVTLLGLPGVGKTHLMIAFALKQMEAGRRVKFFNFNELVGRLRQLSYQSSQVYEAELDKIKKTQILVLDDVGAERGTPLSADIFNCILEYRLNNRTPLFITTNCSESDLVSKFHERAYSRLKELTIIVQIDGKDYRNNIQISLQNKKMSLATSSRHQQYMEER